MALVKDKSIFDKHKPNIIIETSIPWCAHHDNTLILRNAFNGHVFLKVGTRSESIYYLGCANGLQPPILLKHLYSFKTVAPVQRATMDLISIVGRRLQNEDELDNQPLENEKLARSVIWGIAKYFGMEENWLDMERSRVSALIKFYNLANIQLIYPMITSQTSALEDVTNAYLNGKIIPLTVPHMEVFQWISDILA